MDPCKMIRVVAAERELAEEDQDIFADADYTAWWNDCMETFMAYRARRTQQRHNKGALDDFHTYHAKLKPGNESAMRDAYLFAARTLAGFTEAQIEEMVFDMLTREGTEICAGRLAGVSVTRGLRPNRLVMDPIMELKDRTDMKVSLVSASPEPVVRATAKFHKIDRYFTYIIGLRYKTDERGVLTTQLQTPYSLFRGKVRCIQKYIHETRRPIAVFGDSINDLGMLEYAILPLVVDRDNSLSRIAEERGWMLLREQ